MNCPPVLFLIFNRPDLTCRVFEKIREARPSQLYVAADGPRPDHPTDKGFCAESRGLIEGVDWECEVHTLFREENLGCKLAVSESITWFFEHVEEGIILEDDCLPCSDFFTFCFELLERYRHEPSVAMISGDNFQGGKWRGEGSYYFSRFIHIWGWASWRRAWEQYDVDMKSWPQTRKDGFLKRCGLDKIEIEYWTDIFDRTYAGQIDTWDYQWFFSCWSQNKLGIIPNVNLVTNIGVSPDATHTKEVDGALVIPTGGLSDLIHPAKISENRVADRHSFNEHFGGRLIREKQNLIVRVRYPLNRIRVLAGLLLRSEFLWNSWIGNRLQREGYSRQIQALDKESQKAGSEAEQLFITEHCSDLVVRSGPFQGMLYPRARSHGSALIPKLLGCYEFELHPFFRSIKFRKYDWIVDIGCAEGYYAVGCALLWPESEILAFDIDSNARHDAQEMAELNNVGSRVEFGSQFSFSDIKGLCGKGKGLLICDVEGAEKQIFLNNANLDLLRNVDLIVECHDFLIPGISEQLADAIQKMQVHKVEYIDTVGDPFRPFQYSFPLLAGLSIQTQIGAMAEWRAAQMRWLTALTRGV